jgi:hypothetical protein
MDDDILREIRAYRDAYAARFDYDLDAMHRDLVARQRESGRRVVSFAEPGPEKASEESSRPDDLGRIPAGEAVEPRR